MKKLVSYFFQGLLFAAPITITVYVLYKVFMLIDGILKLETPGLGILIIILIITFFGFIGSTIIAKPIMSYLENIIDKAPLIKVIYSAIKDLFSAFVGSKKRFTEPVLVKMIKDSDAEKLGFITKENLEDLGITTGKVAVYLPHSYAWSGNLFIVPRSNITPLKASSADVMKFIISGGVTNIGSEKQENE